MKKFFYSIWLKFVKWLVNLPWVDPEEKEIVYNYFGFKDKY